MKKRDKATGPCRERRASTGAKPPKDWRTNLIDVLRKIAFIETRGVESDDPKVIQGHRNRGLPQPVHWVHIIIGAFLVGGGIVGMFFALRAISAAKHPDDRLAPFLGFSVAYFFALAGIILIMRRIRRLRREKLAESVRRSGQSPWETDHAWEEVGARDDGLKRAMGGFRGMALFCGLLLVPLHVYALIRIGIIPHFLSTVDKVAVLFLALHYGFVRLFHGGRGTNLAFITFDRFPYFTGETLDVRFGVIKDVGEIRDLTFALRCVRERVVIRQYYSGGSDSRWSMKHLIQAVRLYEDVQRFGEPVRLRVRTPDLAVSFPLNADFANRLLDDPPQYWELNVTGKLNKGRLDVDFLLPVYRKGGPKEEREHR